MIDPALGKFHTVARRRASTAGLPATGTLGCTNWFAALSQTNIPPSNRFVNEPAGMLISAVDPSGTLR